MTFVRIPSFRQFFRAERTQPAKIPIVRIQDERSTRALEAVGDDLQFAEVRASVTPGLFIPGSPHFYGVSDYIFTLSEEVGCRALLGDLSHWLLIT